MYKYLTEYIDFDGPTFTLKLLVCRNTSLRAIELSWLLTAQIGQPINSSQFCIYGYFFDFINWRIVHDVVASWTKFTLT